MQDYELIASVIDRYADLQLIINADDPKKEAERQMRIAKTKLEALGVVTTTDWLGK
ncbi:MAG: hypothetical protein NC084_06435 [Bacteroides sp.]|nr:hypothetical protein [Eubacterium sp.]MCM1418139.1 hypothetical protein [Roseburia sp.]MCM1462337.1 hypothetical protein [Bacteroides sp.]